MAVKKTKREMTSREAIRLVAMQTAEFLAKKNDDYGDSALSAKSYLPGASKLTVLERIDAQLDHKLNRIVMGGAKNFESVEATIDDIVGYWLLRKAYLLKQKSLRKRKA